MTNRNKIHSMNLQSVALLFSLASASLCLVACATKPAPAPPPTPARTAKAGSPGAGNSGAGMGSMGITTYDRSGQRAGDFTITKDSVTGTTYDQAGHSKTATGRTPDEVFKKLEQ
jgi:hypothetical protein